MEIKHYTFFAAADYNCGSYGVGAYNENEACSTQGGGTGTGGGTNTSADTNTNNGGPLANTGFDIIIPIALGVAVIVAAGILVVKKLTRKSAK